MFPTTIAGSLPNPACLAEPNKLWPEWRSAGAELASAKADATLLALKEQEDSSIDVVTDGEMSCQHFVHGFLEQVDGIDFAHKVEMGIRADRYKAMVPQVVGEVRLKGRVHASRCAAISPSLSCRRWGRGGGLGDLLAFSRTERLHI
ncbi:MAG: 5-methyltetrahydropteroyltriglutamate--homocysteine methyltransferase [Methylobacteriaceae bacterium]|jgi:5-methyltetrahydropteroyltriglutamate--homocysteine methyltransferase|nr:5-methyltetrahydropteroyltriglutamate--homocysteine methyltransferase [Methylobacteriaceae bacterium]